MTRSIRLLLVLSALVDAAPAQAQETVDQARGLALARQVCADCHAIQDHALRSPNPKAPTFSDISRTPGMTETALTVALTTPHAGMPMFRLSAGQQASLIAYILSLRDSGPTPGR